MKKIHIQARVDPVIKDDVAILKIIYERNTSEMVEILIRKGISYLKKDLDKYKKKNKGKIL